jgi:hypothetical protein
MTFLLTSPRWNHSTWRGGGGGDILGNDESLKVMQAMTQILVVWCLIVKHVVPYLGFSISLCVIGCQVLQMIAPKLLVCGASRVGE